MRARAYKNALWGRITSMPDENGVSMLYSRWGASSNRFSFGTFLAEREGAAQPIPHSEKVQNERERLNHLSPPGLFQKRKGAAQPSTKQARVVLSSEDTSLAGKITILLCTLAAP